MRVPGAMESPKPRAVYWNQEGAWMKMLTSSGEEGGKCTAMVVLVSGTKRIDVAWTRGKRRRASSRHVGGVIMVVVVSVAEASSSLGERKKGLAIWKACWARWCFILFFLSGTWRRRGCVLGGEDVGAYMVVVEVVIGRGSGEAPVPCLAHSSAVPTALITGRCEWLDGKGETG